MKSSTSNKRSHHSSRRCKTEPQTPEQSTIDLKLPKKTKQKRRHREEKVGEYHQPQVTSFEMSCIAHSVPPAFLKLPSKLRDRECNSFDERLNMVNPRALPHFPGVGRRRPSTLSSDSESERCRSPAPDDVLTVLESMSLSPGSFALSSDTDAIVDDCSDTIVSMYSPKVSSPSSPISGIIRSSLPHVEEVVGVCVPGDIRKLRRHSTFGF